LLQLHFAKGNGFLLENVTGDEIWFKHFDPKTKQHSMEYHHISPQEAVVVVGTLVAESICAFQRRKPKPYP
jgi:hypothetical protein